MGVHDLDKIAELCKTRVLAVRDTVDVDFAGRIGATRRDCPWVFATEGPARGAKCHDPPEA